jgi:hypothetical protein
MKKNGLFRSIVNAVVQEEKKRYAGKPSDLLIDQKKQRWYKIMNFIDDLDAESRETESDAGPSNP